MLKRASPVFKAMLQPTFREGHELATTSASEIPLPDDDVGPMIILLNIMHLRNASVPPILGPTQIVDVVNLAKKYICVEVVQLAGRIWLASNLPLHRDAPDSVWDRLHRDADTTTCGRMLTAAYHLGRDDLINELGEAIVRNSTSHTKVTDEYTMYGVEGDRELEMIFGMSFTQPNRACNSLSLYLWRHRLQAVVCTIKLTSSPGMLKAHKIKRFGYIDWQLKELHETFERTRAPKSFLGNSGEHECPESCFVAEVATYELHGLLRQYELDDDTRQRCELYKVQDNLQRLPAKFPFSSRYRPCSAGCVYYRLARAYNDRFQGIVKILCQSSRPLLCMEGYRKYGRRGAKIGNVGMGYCDHCETGLLAARDSDTSSDEE